MYKTLLLAFFLLLGSILSTSAAASAASAASATVGAQPLLKRVPKDKSRSGRYVHRPNYKRYKGPGNPHRGFIALFR